MTDGMHHLTCGQVVNSNYSGDTGGWHMSLPEGLYPEKVFYYFEEISTIPHGSGNTKELAKYIQAFAEERKLKNIVDNYGNVIIFADGTEVKII